MDYKAKEARKKLEMNQKKKRPNFALYARMRERAKYCTIYDRSWLKI